MTVAPLDPQALISPRALKGHFDIVLINGDNVMGFITRAPGSSRQINNTAPNINIGGSSQYSGEAFNQHLFDGFEMGGDKEYFEDGENRYAWSDGNVSLHQPGRVTLESQWAILDTGVTVTAPQILDFNAGRKYVVWAVGTKVRAYDTTDETVADSGTFATDATYLFANDQYLWACCGANMYRWDAATDTTVWTTQAFATNGLGWYKDTLYRFTGRQLIAATNNDGSAWSASPVNVGYPTTDIKHVFESMGLLFVSKPEGLYSYDGTTVRLVVDARFVRSTLNFRAGMDFNNVALFNKLTTVQKGAGLSGANFSAVSEINTEMRGSAAREQYGHGTPVTFFNGPRRAYLAFDDGEGVYPELLSYNGIGLHQVYRGTSGDTMQAAGYSALMGWLLVADGSVRRKRILNASDEPYPDAAASGQFITPWVHGGLPDNTKWYKSIELELEDATGTETVAIEYETELSSGFVAVETLTGNGRQEVPLGGLTDLPSAKKMRWRITLARGGDETTRPKIVLPIVVRLMPAPEPVDGKDETLVIELTQALRNKAAKTVGDVYTLQQMRQFIDDLRISESVITHIDEWGFMSNVKPTDRSSTPRRLEAEATDDPDRRNSSLRSLRLMDVYTGFQRHQFAPAVVGAITVEHITPTSPWKWNDGTRWGENKWGV